MNEKKQYNNLNDVEKHILREYKSWCKSDCDLNYKIAIATQWRERAIEEDIQHLL